MFATRFATYLRYCENSLTYFHPVFPIIYSKQAYINFNVPKVSDETFRSNLHLHLHYIFHEHFPDATQLERTWGERKEKKNMERFATRFL